MAARYSRIAMALHWIIAFAILFQISLGWGLETLSRGQIFPYFQLHKSVGITILLLSLIRVAVRFIKPRPPAVEGGFTGFLGKAVHFGFYFVMIAAPLTGWAIVSTSKTGVPTILYGLIPWPNLPLPQAAQGPAEGIHSIMGWLTFGLLLLHLAGVVRHQLLLRDGLIWRMAPGRSAIVAAVLVIAALGGLVVGKLILPPGKQDAGPQAAMVANAVDNGMADAVEAVENVVDNAAEGPADNAADNATVPVGPPPKWTIAPGGRLGFSVANGDEQIIGRFTKWTGSIVMDPDHPQTAQLDIAIDLASASIGDAYKDEMIGNEDFFGTAAHPRATFRSSQITSTSPGRYRAKGTLVLKGVSAPQVISFTLTGEGMTRKVTGSGTIARKTFNVGTGESAEGIAPMVSVNFAFSATGRAP